MKHFDRAAEHLNIKATTKRCDLIHMHQFRSLCEQFTHLIDTGQVEFNNSCHTRVPCLFTSDLSVIGMLIMSIYYICDLIITEKNSWSSDSQGDISNKHQ